MIQSKNDYEMYVASDLKANKVSSKFSSLIQCRLYAKYNILYLLYLRKLEFLINCSRRGWITKVYIYLISRRLKHWSAFTGISIQPNSFGKGLYIPHWGAIIVNGTARFGDNCIVQSGVNVSEGVCGGNHIYLGTGAKLLINVKIADDVIVGANAVVNRSVTIPNVVVGGVPAKVISNKGFRDRGKV